MTNNKQYHSVSKPFFWSNLSIIKHTKRSKKHIWLFVLSKWTTAGSCLRLTIRHAHTQLNHTQLTFVYFTIQKGLFSIISNNRLWLRTFSLFILETLVNFFNNAYIQTKQTPVSSIFAIKIWASLLLIFYM